MNGTDIDRLRKSEKQFDTDLGKILRIMRPQAGMTQTELTRKLGISYQQWQKYEKGRNRITVSRLSTFLRAADWDGDVALPGEAL